MFYVILYIVLYFIFNFGQIKVIESAHIYYFFLNILYLIPKQLPNGTKPNGKNSKYI